MKVGLKFVLKIAQIVLFIKIYLKKQTYCIYCIHKSPLNVVFHGGKPHYCETPVRVGLSINITN